MGDKLLNIMVAGAFHLTMKNINSLFCYNNGNQGSIESQYSQHFVFEKKILEMFCFLKEL